jgi:hypothetical protein
MKASDRFIDFRDPGKSEPPWEPAWIGDRQRRRAAVHRGRGGGRRTATEHDLRIKPLPAGQNNPLAGGPIATKSIPGAISRKRVEKLSD